MKLRHILAGMASLNLFPPPLDMNPEGLPPEELDRRALASDWAAVQGDLHRAYQKLAAEHDQHAKTADRSGGLPGEIDPL